MISFKHKNYISKKCRRIRALKSHFYGATHKYFYATMDLPRTLRLLIITYPQFIPLAALFTVAFLRPDKMPN
jgi:hypothetical protein